MAEIIYGDLIIKGDFEDLQLYTELASSGTASVTIDNPEHVGLQLVCGTYNSKVSIPSSNTRLKWSLPPNYSPTITTHQIRFISDGVEIYVWTISQPPSTELYEFDELVEQLNEEPRDYVYVQFKLNSLYANPTVRIEESDITSSASYFQIEEVIHNHNPLILYKISKRMLDRDLKFYITIRLASGHVLVSDTVTVRTIPDIPAVPMVAEITGSGLIDEVQDVDIIDLGEGHVEVQSSDISVATGYYSAEEDKVYVTTQSNPYMAKNYCTLRVILNHERVFVEIHVEVQPGIYFTQEPIAVSKSSFYLSHLGGEDCVYTIGNMRYTLGGNTYTCYMEDGMSNKRYIGDGITPATSNIYVPDLGAVLPIGGLFTTSIHANGSTQIRELMVTPKKVTDLTVEEFYDDGYVRLSWNPNSPKMQYKVIIYRADSDSTFIRHNEDNQLYVDIDIQESYDQVTFEFIVSADDIGGEGPPSDTLVYKLEYPEQPLLNQVNFTLITLGPTTGVVFNYARTPVDIPSTVDYMHVRFAFNSTVLNESVTMTPGYTSANMGAPRYSSGDVLYWEMYYTHNNGKSIPVGLGSPYTIP